VPGTASGPTAAPGQSSCAFAHRPPVYPQNRRSRCPVRSALGALFARFHLDLFELLIRWADLAKDQITAWPRTDGLGMTEPTRALLDDTVTRLEALTARAAGQPTPGPEVT